MMNHVTIARSFIDMITQKCYPVFAIYDTNKMKIPRFKCFFPRHFQFTHLKYRSGFISVQLPVKSIQCILYNACLLQRNKALICDRHWLIQVEHKRVAHNITKEGRALHGSVVKLMTQYYTY